MPQAAPPVETIDTYAVASGVCTNTQKDSFTLGEEVCARVSNSPLRAAAPLRRVSIGDTDGTVSGTVDVTADPQTLIITLPTSTTSVVDSQIVDNRGIWSATINSTEDNGLRAVAYFSVSDPTQEAADLAVYAASTDTEALSPGQSTGFSVYVNNIGPDAAEDVHVTQTVPPFMTFDSATAGSGTPFTCSETSGVVDCVPSGNLARGAVSTFTLNYTVSSGAPSTLVNTSINVESDTTDPRPASNSSTVKVEIRAANTPPATCSVACPADITINADTTNGSGDPGAIVNFSGNIETSGECGAIQSSPASGAFFPVGSTTVTVSSETGGGSCSFVVNVTNIPPPTINCPANIGVQAADNECSATVDVGTPETTGDDVSVAGVRSDGQTLDAPYPAGTTTITWTATDSLGRKVSCQQTVTVTVNDTTPPTITAPPDVTVNTPGDTTGNCGVVVGESELGTPTTNDNCTAALTVSRTGVPAGNFFPVGTTTITYTVTDAGGNTATATQHVTVHETTPPRIAAPPDASYTCPSEVPAANPSQATNGGGLDENGNPIPPGPPSDNCGVPVVTVTETRSGAGSVSSPLVIKRTFTATDAAGNSASSTQTITVTDPTPPSITLNGPSSMTVECHTAFTDPGASASDNCGAATVSVGGNLNVNVPGTYTVTYTATDAAGNTSAPISRTVTVVDTTPPTISCQANIIVGYDAAAGGAVVNYTTPVGSDSCAGSLTATQTAGLASGSTFPLGTTTNTFTVTDGAGLTASCSFKVTVALTSIVGLDSVSITGAGPVDSYDSNGGYPATKGSLANVLSNGTITMTGSAKVAGNVRSTRAGVAMSGASQVTGNATAGTTVSRSGSATVGGTITNNALAPVISLPAVPSCGPPYSPNSGITGTYSYNAGTGDLSLSGVQVATLANGTYCFHNLSIGNSAQLKVNGPVTIKLTGTLSTGGAGSLNNTTLIPGNLRILSSYSGAGGVSFTNSASAYLVIYAPNTGVTVSGAAPLYGTVAGKTLTISNSGMLHYDTRLQSVWVDLWQSILGP